MGLVWIEEPPLTAEKDDARALINRWCKTGLALRDPARAVLAATFDVRSCRLLQYCSATTAEPLRLMRVPEEKRRDATPSLLHLTASCHGGGGAGVRRSVAPTGWRPGNVVVLRPQGRPKCPMRVTP